MIYRPTIAQYRVIGHLQRGNALCKELTEDGPRFYYARGGATPKPITVKCLLDRAVIASNKDGLFGEAQTYHLIRVDV